MTETSVLDRVLDASSLEDLDSSGKKPKRVYLMYAKQIHPDLFLSDEDKFKAKEAFAHLNSLKEKLEGKAPSSASNKLKTKKHEYTLEERVYTNGISTTFHGTYDAGHQLAYLTFVNNPADSDLVENHISTLKRLKDVPEDFVKFYPEHVESFRHRDASGKDRIVSVSNRFDGFVPMSKVLEVCPNGIGGRDVAWIFRRMLVALGNAHDIGIVNGAPVLESWLIHPELHGIILADWSYSIASGETLKAVPEKARHLYPEKYLQKQPVSGTLDINLASRVAEQLLASGEPSQLFAFFKGCRLASTPKASKLLAEFDDLLLRIYGKPRFSPFTLNR